MRGPLIALLCGLASTSFAANPPKPPDTVVKIESTPPGALVLVSEGSEYRAGAAVPLGKTPLMRLMQLPPSGLAVHMTKAGYQPWEGQLSPGAGEIAASLSPLSDDQRKSLGWFESPVPVRLVVLPVRTGIQKIGTQGTELERSPEGEQFVKRFMGAFERTAKQRFGSQVEIATPATDGLWKELTSQIEGINVATIGFTPAPFRLKLAGGETLGPADGAVLLVRAEAHYLGKGAVFARAAVPLLLTAGSALAGMGTAQATGSPVYTYSIYGAPPSVDEILVQVFLVHGGTHELMWFGQVTMPDYYAREQATEKTASKAAEQIPSALLKKQ